MQPMQPFPIPGVTIGPGSQVEDVELDYMPMPQGMQTYAMPILPEREELTALQPAQRVLRAVLAATRLAAGGGVPEPVALAGLDAANLALVNQVLGEGEVSARIEGEQSVRIQEAIFAGIWRTHVTRHGRLASDDIDVGPVPPVLVSAARAAASVDAIVLPERLPPGAMNAPAIATEINDAIARWRPDAPAHVINLTLLPLSPQDVGFLEQSLSGGSVLMLSRGYGNCRILSTSLPNCWRVVYYNSSDTILLNTVEITAIPDVACAAPEDLLDSAERLAEVLEWVAGA